MGRYGLLALAVGVCAFVQGRRLGRPCVGRQGPFRVGGLTGVGGHGEVGKTVSFNGASLALFGQAVRLLEGRQAWLARVTADES